MAETVGIRFKRAGPVHYFDAAGIEVEVNDYVVVETTHGLAVGKVVISPKQVLASELTEPLKPVVRKASPEDLQQRKGLEAEEKETLLKASALVADFQLPMKLLAAEYSLDKSHLVLYFRAEKRVDFRALLRELIAMFKARIELRQVGVRDAAKLVGGLGKCGRPLCCATHLCQFDAVSMKMAKRQDLPLMPPKISGVCGRLLCCLSYEDEQYRKLKQKLPRAGRTVATPHGIAKVVGSNAIKQTVLVQLENEAILELPLAEVTDQTTSSAQK